MTTTTWMNASRRIHHLDNLQSGKTSMASSPQTVACMLPTDRSGQTRFRRSHTRTRASLQRAMARGALQSGIWNPTAQSQVAHINRGCQRSPPANDRPPKADVRPRKAPNHSPHPKPAAALNQPIFRPVRPNTRSKEPAPRAQVHPKSCHSRQSSSKRRSVLPGTVHPHWSAACKPRGMV
jgi:hypothetical protein